MKEPKTIEVSPGSGWRWLEDNEIIEADDEVFIYTQARFIKPTTRLGKPAGEDGSDGFPVRRKIENDWVVQDRVPPREKIDQVSYAADDKHWFIARGEWTSMHGSSFGSAGKLKVRCRRKDLPPIEPKCKQECFSGGGSPSPRQCDICGDGPCQKAKPVENVESPEDWVTQDRVPDRPGIDQWRRVWNGKAQEWELSYEGQERYMHGHVATETESVFEVRCRRKDLPPLPAPPADGQWGVGPAREALEKIAAQCKIDSKNLKSAELGEKISLAMLKEQISELRDQVAILGRRLEKLDKTPVPDVFTTVVKDGKGEYRFIPPGPHAEPEPGRYTLNDDEVIEKGDRFFVKHCGWFFCNNSIGRTRRKFLSDNPQFIGTIGPVTRSFS